MTWLTAGWVRPSAFAAPEKLPSLDDGQKGLELVDIH